MVRVLLDSREVQSDAHGPVSLTDMLTAGDHARVLALWLREALRLGRWWLVRDRKARSLSVGAIPGIRQYYLDLAFARRIDRVYGRPRAVLSLAPWSDTSVAIVDVMKARGVATGATRTQTTIDIEEHLTINADLLFCKSTWERGIYGRLFRGHGPRLVDGCLLSLPEEYPPGAARSPGAVRPAPWHGPPVERVRGCLSAGVRQLGAGCRGPGAARGLPRPPRPRRRARARRGIGGRTGRSSW